MKHRLSSTPGHILCRVLLDYALKSRVHLLYCSIIGTRTVVSSCSIPGTNSSMIYWYSTWYVFFRCFFLVVLPGGFKQCFLAYGSSRVMCTMYHTYESDTYTAVYIWYTYSYKYMYTKLEGDLSALSELWITRAQQEIWCRCRPFSPQVRYPYINR